MSDLPALDGPRAEPLNGGSAKHLIILLHGLGADGNDLIQLSPYLGRAVPDAAFVSPNAPQPCDMAPMGRQWFSLQDRDAEVLIQGADTAAPILDAFIDAEMARHGLDAGKVALLGFSQGGMMALHTGLQREQPLAAICSFSGALLGSEYLPERIRSRPPVLLVHGDSDDVVPSRALPAAEAALAANRVPVTAETRPGLGHGIDERGIQLAMEFLQKHLAGAQSA